MIIMLKYRYVGICEKEVRARRDLDRIHVWTANKMCQVRVREGFLVFSPRYVSRVCIGSFEKLEGVVFP